MHFQPLSFHIFRPDMQPVTNTIPNDTYLSFCANDLSGIHRTALINPNLTLTHHFFLHIIISKLIYQRKSGNPSCIISCVLQDYLKSKIFLWINTKKK